MRRSVFTLALVLGGTLALTGCNRKAADEGKPAASVDVLPGSASDAMIAYDTLRSQPPLVREEDEGNGAETDDSAQRRSTARDGAGRGEPTTEATRPAAEASTAAEPTAPRPSATPQPAGTAAAR